MRGECCIQGSIVEGICQHYESIHAECLVKAATLSKACNKDVARVWRSRHGATDHIPLPAGSLDDLSRLFVLSSDDQKARVAVGSIDVTSTRVSLDDNSADGNAVQCGPDNQDGSIGVHEHVLGEDALRCGDAVVRETAVKGTGAG